MEKYFDAFVHVANWGTRCLSSAFRRMYSRAKLHRSTMPMTSSNSIAMDVFTDCVADQSHEGRSPLPVPWMAPFDSGGGYEGDIQEDDVEPPVPAGLRTLSQPLECFANFLGID